MNIELLTSNQDEALEIISKGVRDYNRSKLNQTADRLVGTLKNDHKEVIGGYVGYMFKDEVLLDLLWVRDDQRGKGLGRKLVQHLEEACQIKNCPLIKIDTYSYQAPVFYEKCGYEEYGRVKQFIQGHDRIFMKKRISK